MPMGDLQFIIIFSIVSIVYFAFVKLMNICLKKNLKPAEKELVTLKIKLKTLEDYAHKINHDNRDLLSAQQNTMLEILNTLDKINEKINTHN